MVMASSDEEEDWEAIREANIRENQIILERLGLGSNVLGIPPKASKKGIAHGTKPVRKRRIDSKQPTRKSRRLLASSEPDPRPLEPDSSSKIILRKLSPPPIPLNPVLFSPAPTPQRDPGEYGTLRFVHEPHFTPNLTPAEMMQLGSFGGSFFRPFHSAILRSHIEPDYDEFPAEWYQNINADSLLTSEVYNPSINRYGVKAGQSLEEWEKAGWIRAQDPRGWFQWYCRFYTGRRTADDVRQISRWTGVCGANGRFKKSLVKKVAQAGSRWDDTSIAPILRQTLQHWGYVLTKDDYLAYA